MNSSPIPTSNNIDIQKSRSICNNVFHEIAFEVINFDDKKTTFNTKKICLYDQEVNQRR